MSTPKTYSFNDQILSSLKGFASYLQQQGNSPATIKQKTNYAGDFLQWLEAERLHAEDTRYNDIINYVDHCTRGGESKRLINRKLSAVRNYYQYHKKKINPKTENPATGIVIRGMRKSVPSGILPYKELEDLYKNYPAVSLKDKRNKVILGILVYQGLTTGELQRMEPTHLKPESGTIYIPGTRKTSGRSLELKPFQVMELHHYLKVIRKHILRGIHKPGPGKATGSPGRKPDRLNSQTLDEKLFISINGSENIKSSLTHMFRAIRKENPHITSPKQIRASVISWWLKNYNLRQVQYMAGHKYVSSTERYQLNNLDKLQSKLEKFHPLG